MVAMKKNESKWRDGTRGRRDKYSFIIVWNDGIILWLFDITNSLIEIQDYFEIFLKFKKLISLLSIWQGDVSEIKLKLRWYSNSLS